MSIYKKDGMWVAIERNTYVVIARNASLAKLMRLVTG
jgi:hypothetical protein